MARANSRTIEFISIEINFQSLLPRVQKIFNFKNIKQDIDTNLVFIDTIQVFKKLLKIVNTILKNIIFNISNESNN